MSGLFLRSTRLIRGLAGNALRRESPQLAVVFDVDGVVLDTENTARQSIARLFDNFNKSLPKTPTARTLLRDAVPKERSMCLLNPALIEGSPEHQEWCEFFSEAYAMADEQYTTMYPQVMSVISILKNQGYQLIAASNKDQGMLEKNMDRFQLARHFDVIAGKDGSSKLAKPDEAFFNKKIKSKIQSSTVLMVGDSHQDAVFAERCGMHFTWASYGYGELCSFASTPKFIISSPSGLLTVANQLLQEPVASESTSPILKP